MPTFSTPTVNDRRMAGGRSPAERRFWGRFGLQPTGQTVIRENGTWSTIGTYAPQSRLDGADSIRDAGGNVVPGYFLGGHVYQVSAAIGAELTSAGYTVL
jgi:hypothetical protein